MACKKIGYESVISGHIYHAEIRKIHGVDYMNCGDWVESCTALVENQDGGIEIIHYGGLINDKILDITNEAA